ncbi:MAG TPA: hypothetical protein VN904_01655 [Chthoniobacterales bacterium]|nr:hypothetical protein [Chthoniobacterales bacterium]
MLGDAEILERAETRAAFLNVDLLAETLRVAFALRAAGFLFGEVFFFFDLAIIQKAPRDQAPEKTEA